MKIAFEITGDDIDAIGEFAESVGGSFGVTHEGRLIIADVSAAAGLVADQPFERFYLELIDETTVGLQF